MENPKNNLNQEKEKTNFESSIQASLAITDNPAITDDYSNNDKYLQVVQVLSLGLMGVLLFSFVMHYDSLLEIFPNTLVTGAFTGSTNIYFGIGLLFFLGLIFYLYLNEN